MNLTHATEGKEYIVSSVEVEDSELDSFLFSLGCYKDQPITVIKRRRSVYIVSIKDGRYCIDRALAEAIKI